MRLALALISLGALLGGAKAELCHTWSPGVSLGALDSVVVSEASGLAVSNDGFRLYHINDSGGGPFFYTSSLAGQNLKRILIQGGSLQDSEALAFGPLLGAPTLIVGDIGDNLLRRKSIELFAIRESAIGVEDAPIFGRITVQYPDGPHNAEGLALTPDGSVYIFTKSWAQGRFDSAPSRVYRLSPTAWRQTRSAPVRLELIGEIDLPALSIRERAPFSDVVTDASMSADGSRFLLLTYGYAWEFALDLSSGRIPSAADLQRGRDYELIRLEPMLGKETVAYLPGDRSFVFGKEFKPDSKPSRLIRLNCLD